MSSIKNPTLRRRTKELSELAEDIKECQLCGYELKEVGSLISKMAIHMGDLQRKVDSQAEHIKMLNEKLTADIPQTEEPYIDIETGILHWCGWKYRRIEDESQTGCKGCEHWKYIAHEWQCETVKCQKTPQTEMPEYAEWKDAYNKMTDCGWK